MELGYANVYTRFFTLSYLQVFVWPQHGSYISLLHILLAACI